MMMHSLVCPKCDEEMEEVVDFPGYVWCRECHITKKVDGMDANNEEESSAEPKQVTNQILDIIQE